MIIDINKTAELSKLSIPKDKEDMFEKQMNEIVQMIEVLSQIDDDNALYDSRRAFLREDDRACEQISHDEIMNNAPATKDGMFCVPKTV